MRTECTELFFHYREVARLVWNLGFWQKPALREWACERAYDEAIARLFEGMILRPLGRQERIEVSFCPGEVAPFLVTANNPGVQLWVDGHLPNEPGRLWGRPMIDIGSQPYKLKFIAFFDWYQLAPRDFSFLKVLVERLDDRSDLVGRHALVEMAQCSIWYEDESDQQGDDSSVS